MEEVILDVFDADVVCAELDVVVVLDDVCVPVDDFFVVLGNEFLDVAVLVVVLVAGDEIDGEVGLVEFDVGPSEGEWLAADVDFVRVLEVGEVVNLVFVRLVFDVEEAIFEGEGGVLYVRDLVGGLELKPLDDVQVVFADVVLSGEALACELAVDGFEGDLEGVGEGLHLVLQCC